MDDLIKRQDAITAYCEHECGIKGMTRENCGATDCGTIFDDIPSAQPEILASGQGELVQDGSRLVQDCIGRQAAIHALRKMQTYKLFAGDDMLLIDQAEAMTEVMLLPSAQQWIPCSERPPEEDFWSGRGRQFSDHVFVTIVNHANDDEHFTDTAQTVDGIWQLSNDVDGDCRLPDWCEIIAWMPLPEPYKGEES